MERLRRMVNMVWTTRRKTFGQWFLVSNPCKAHRLNSNECEGKEQAMPVPSQTFRIEESLGTEMKSGPEASGRDRPCDHRALHREIMAEVAAIRVQMGTHGHREW